MNNLSASKSDFTLVSGAQIAPVSETKVTRTQKLSQERTDLQYLQQNLESYSLAVANLEMILKGINLLRTDSFDDSKLAGVKIRIPMQDDNHLTHTLGKGATLEIKKWVEASRRLSPKLLDTPSQSVKDLEAAKDSIRQITEKVALGYFLSNARGHYIKQIKQTFPDSRKVYFGLAQHEIEMSAEALGMQDAEIETVKNSVYTDSDYAALYINEAAGALASHKGVLKHLRREIDLRTNLLEVQSTCFKAGLRLD